LRLRSLLREYYPGMLTALAHTKGTLASLVGRTLLAAAPDPATAAELTENDIAALLVKAGRSRAVGIHRWQQPVTEFRSLVVCAGGEIHAYTSP
jgi:hypothetical protein